jgi:hypothetical protein
MRRDKSRSDSTIANKCSVMQSAVIAYHIEARCFCLKPLEFVWRAKPPAARKLNRSGDGVANDDLRRPAFTFSSLCDEKETKIFRTPYPASGFRRVRFRP